MGINRPKDIPKGIYKPKAPPPPPPKSGFYHPDSEKFANDLSFMSEEDWKIKFKKDMISKEILTKIEENGFICDYNLSEEESKILRNLRKDGILETIKDVGIAFINAEYFYILKGNPRKLRVVTEGCNTFLKPNLKVRRK